MHWDLSPMICQNEVSGSSAGEKKESFSRIFLANDQGGFIELLVGGHRLLWPYVHRPVIPLETGVVSCRGRPTTCLLDESLKWQFTTVFLAGQDGKVINSHPDVACDWL